MKTLILDVSIYGVWFLNNKFFIYYWDKDRGSSNNNTEIIYAASATNILIKGKTEQSFIEIISYPNKLSKIWN